MRWLPIVAALLVTHSGFAQTTAPGPVSASQPARNVVSVNIGEGRLLRLDREAANVFVADASVADVQIATPRAIYVYGRKTGQTTLTAVGNGEVLAGNLTIRVVRSADAAQDAVRRGGAPIDLRFAGDRLVLAGPIANLGAAMEADAAAQAYSPSGLPPLDATKLAGTQQITLRVRAAEVSRSDLNRLGVNLSAIARPGSFIFNLATNGLIGNGTGADNVSPVNAGETSFNGALGIITNRLNANALIDALQREGVVTVLAEPNLTTISGETANFLAGGEVPVPVPQSLGVTTIQYKPFGVSLAFTPTLLPGGRIAMRVRQEVSQISTANSVQINGYVAPSFTTRRAETNLELGSGQTVAIAGLFQSTFSDSIDRTPFLGDIPVLGALFRSQRFQRQETELVIVVTPYLSSPVNSPNSIALPTDDARRTRPPIGTVVAGFDVN